MLGDDTKFPNQPGYYTAAGTWKFQNTSDQEAASQSRKDFREGDRNTFMAAQDALTNAAYLDNEFDRLKGTALEPGWAGESRVRLAQAYNTSIDWLNSQGANIDNKNKVEVGAVGSGEAIIKSAIQLGYNFTKFSFGNQREAAQTIQTSLKAVPGLENSYYGGKLLIATVQAGAQRQIDLRNFQRQWLNDPRAHGSLEGSEEEFNRQYPGVNYANGVLAKFGLTKDGFESRAKIDEAFQNGWISKETAANAQIQFTKSHSPPPAQPTPMTPGSTRQGSDIAPPSNALQPSGISDQF
jgi:hypothetical protein